MTKYTLMQLKQTSSPAEFARNLRDMGDVYWWEPGKFQVVTSYHLAKEVLLNEVYSCDRNVFRAWPSLRTTLLQESTTVCRFRVLNSWSLRSPGDLARRIQLMFAKAPVGQK